MRAAPHPFRFLVGCLLLTLAGAAAAEPPTRAARLGYAAGTRFPILVKHIEKVIIVVVLVSILPGIVAYAKAKLGAARAQSGNP